MRCIPLAALSVAAILGSPLSVAAQGSRAGAWEAGLSVGATPNLSLAFTRCDFRGAGKLAGRLGYRLARSWHLDVRTEVVRDGGPSTCFACEACFCSFDRCVAPPPVVGPYVIRDGRFAPLLDGSPLWSTSLGSQWTVAERPGHEWRVRAGLGRLWGTRLWAPQVSSSFDWGAGPLRATFELGLWHYTVQRTDVETSFFDGQIVSQTTSGVPVHETTFFFDLGLTIRSVRER